MQHFPLFIDTNGRQIVAAAQQRYSLRARVLYADCMPRFIGEEYTGADYAPVNLALGFGPFLWAWPALRRLPCRVTPIYRRSRYWNPFDPLFLKTGVWRQAAGWWLLRGQICFAHLLRPYDAPTIELPAIGSTVQIDAWSCNVLSLGDDTPRLLVNGWHGPQPSRHCPWLWPERLEVIA